MADTHACVQCSKTRAGRFTRVASGTAGGAWTKGSLPSWHCYKCLPKGKGRGEDEPDVTVTAKTAVALNPKTLLLDKKEGLDRIGPLQTAVTKLGAVIKDEEDYTTADEMLGKVQTARKWWKTKLYGTKTQPGPIPSIKSGLDMLYALNNEVDHPLKALEDGLKARMKSYQEKKLLREREQERDRLEMEAKAARELEEATNKLMAAKTPAAVAKAAALVEEKEQEYVETLTPVQTQTVVANSSTRTPKKPEVQDILKFCQGIADGLIPVECIRLMPSVLNQLYRDAPEDVAAFPGVAIIDDVQIVGRG